MIMRVVARNGGRGTGCEMAKERLFCGKGRGYSPGVWGKEEKGKEKKR